MAHVRDKSGQPVRDREGGILSYVSEGQQESRELRAKKQAEKNSRFKAQVEARACRSPEDQLAVLDTRLGYGKGAEKERQKLYAQIAEREERLRKEREEKEQQEKEAKSKEEKKAAKKAGKRAKKVKDSDHIRS
jgi:hypothetical protein